MIRKAIEKETVPACKKKKGYWTILQVVKEIVVLNIFKDGVLKARHCFNPKNYEHETLHADTGVWHVEKVTAAYNGENGGAYGYWGYKDNTSMSNKDREELNKILEAAGSRRYYKTDVIDKIYDMEQERDRDLRQYAEYRRLQRVQDLMNQVPEEPSDLLEWVDERATGGENWCLKNRETKKWSCSACGKEFDLKEKPRNNDMITCPECGSKITYLSRKKKIEKHVHFCLIQPMGEEIGVARHYQAEICFYPGNGWRKAIGVDEDIRIILYKRSPEDIDITKPSKKKTVDIYYKQWRDGDFDNKGNPTNRREYTGFLYDGGIEEAFKDTEYECWSRLFTQMAAAEIQCNWNNMMVMKKSRYEEIAEMLFRGRFYNMLTESSEEISIWNSSYYGNLYLNGNTIEEVFGINDRQKINRIRDCDGNELVMEWMRYSDRTGEKISENALERVRRDNIDPFDLRCMLDYMSLEQSLNYLERQKKESYPGKSLKVIMSQYIDYIQMCKKLGKKTEDALIYKPRELKRRHDEAVKEIEILGAELDAKNYSEKYPEAEEVLKEIKEKFDYAGEQYFITVPVRIYDIVCEGRNLHHCVSSSDRYFDRIAQHETYICFLRKVEAPDVSFYTIEVEPGGTIRQHRGAYDEEPELEKIKPFLREWQKEIRKRMSKEDHARAKKSKILREANIKELQEKNNTKVLKGLEEDLMEAV